jgi:hypothetical protein
MEPTLLDYMGEGSMVEKNYDNLTFARAEHLRSRAKANRRENTRPKNQPDDHPFILELKEAEKLLGMQGVLSRD